jgi:hypothetical protein
MPRFVPSAPEVCERAIRLAAEQTPSRGSRYATVRSVAEKLGHPATFRDKVR